jgi:uncharacterized membrane protein
VEEYVMDGIMKDTKKKMSVVYYILIMLSFSVPLLIVGYFVTRNGNTNVFIFLMLILVFGMRSIDDYIRRQFSMAKSAGVND